MHWSRHMSCRAQCASMLRILQGTEGRLTVSGSRGVHLREGAADGGAAEERADDAQQLGVLQDGLEEARHLQAEHLYDVARVLRQQKPSIMLVPPAFPAPLRCLHSVGRRRNSACTIVMPPEAALATALVGLQGLRCVSRKSTGTGMGACMFSWAVRSRAWVASSRGKATHGEHGEHVGKGVVDVGVAVRRASLAAVLAKQAQAGHAALDRARRQPHLLLAQAQARLDAQEKNPCQHASLMLRNFKVYIHIACESRCCNCKHQRDARSCHKSMLDQLTGRHDSPWKSWEGCC